MNATEKQLMLLVLAGLVAYLMFKKKLTSITAPATDVLAWWWMLDDPPGVGNVLGNIVLPDGSLIPLASVQLKVDANHNVFANVANAIYQLSPSDANGNWPAVLVS